MTTTQAVVWLEQQLFPGKPIYNTGQFLVIRGNLRFDLFEAALRDVVANSPGLRLDRRIDPKPFDLRSLDLREEAHPMIAAKRWMQSEMDIPIPLDAPDLFCFALIRIGDDHTIWFQKFHHIIIDATGRRLLSRETASRYRALRSGESHRQTDAASPEEILEAERRYAASADWKADRDYWVDEFTGWCGPLHEGTRENTERAKSGRHSRVAFTLKRAQFEELAAAAQESGSSVARTFIALTFAAFARLYDRYDIVFGIELANRSDARTRETIGFLARPLPMRVRLSGGATVADCLRHVEAKRSRDYPHRRYPLQDLGRELAITRKGYHSLFDVIVNYIPAAYDFTFEGPPVEITNLSYGFAVPWVLTIADTGLERDLEVTVDTDGGLIPAEMATRLSRHLEILLQRGLEHLDCPIAELPIMPDADRERVLALGAGDAVVLPADATLDELCAAQAARTPEAAAVICGEEILSFGELHRRAGILARKLAMLGVKPGGIVGIALPRRPALIVAILAIHKAGAAYLALDPSYPADRIRFMVADAGVPLIVTEPAVAALFADCGARLLLEAELAANEPGTVETATAEPTPATARDLAYVLYTSGSTGRPKAVGIEHRNLVNLISWGRSIVADDELRGVLFSTSINFDLSAFEMFLPLAFGGCIVLVEDVLALQSAPHRDRIRLINTGPSVAEALLRAGGLPRGVTKIILAGEVLSRRLARQIFAVAPSVELFNCYGPTETTVYSSFARVRPDEDTEPSIGRPVWNTTLHVLDAGGALTAPGVQGELYIGGAGVSRGYLNRPELTSQRFVPNRHGSGRLYRTGDCVRWLASGELEFLGRADDQIKIHGIRIEPGEIEAALMTLPEVTAAVVVARQDPAGVRRLAAYVVAPNAATHAEEELRAALRLKLPRSMIPASIVRLDTMPLTPNGKLDRKALPAPPRKIQSSSERAAETRVERELALIWQDLLHRPSVNVDADFFDLGGDSLRLVSLFATIEARYRRRLTVDLLAGGLTIAKLAETLTAEDTTDTAKDVVVVLQPSGDLPPFFCVHGIGGDVVNLHRLAVHMGTKRPFLGLRRTSEARETDSIERIAERYVDAMLVEQPRGPFFLGGHSFGAVLAYEMAVQLTRRGHEIGLLAILDQRRPDWRLTMRNALPALPQLAVRLPMRLRDEVMADAPVSERLRGIRRTVGGWLRNAAGLRPDPASLIDPAQNFSEQLPIVVGHQRALRAYRPAPASFPVVVFRAGSQKLSHSALDSTLGWSALVQESVKVVIVPGSHQTMTAEPFVRDWAKALSGELDLAQADARGRRCRVVSALKRR